MCPAGLFDHDKLKLMVEHKKWELCAVLNAPHLRQTQKLNSKPQMRISKRRHERRYFGNKIYLSIKWIDFNTLKYVGCENGLRALTAAGSRGNLSVYPPISVL